MRAAVAVAFGASLTAAGLRSPLLSKAFADGTPGAATDAGFDTFMKVSLYLTGKTSLDTDLGHAIYTGLIDDDANFVSQLNALNALLAATPTPAGDLQKTLDDQHADLATVPKRIMPAWYLGVVGRGAKARTVAYEHALMYPPIADVIVMPSYARGVPGYWAQPPKFSHS